MYTCDIESDAIDKLNPDLVTKIHCIALKKDDEETKLYYGDTLQEAYDTLNSIEGSIVFHNGLSFDVGVLRRIGKVSLKASVIDTFVMSCLLNSDRKGGHSLKSWGIRTNNFKGEYSDWSEYTDAMGYYCIQDVETTRSAYKALVEEMKKHPKGITGWGSAMRLEHKLAAITEEQRHNGIKLDVDKARELLEYIDGRMLELEGIVEPLLPPRAAKKSEEAKLTPPKLQFKKDGTPSALCLKFFESVSQDGQKWVGVKNGEQYELPYHKPVEFDFKMTLANQDDLKEWLLSLGWVPTIWNHKKKDGKYVRENGKLVRTSPKFQDNGKVCEGLERVAFDHIRDVIEWLSLRHRRSLISGLVDNMRTDGRVGADANPCGTPTSRYTHKVVVNIPKADPKVVLGKECRSLFIADKPKVLVGSDAAGLELRILAHYVNDPAFTEAAISEAPNDLHTQLWQSCSEYVESRNVSKGVTYCCLYGGSDTKMGETAGHVGKDAAKIGKIIRERYYETYPAFHTLAEGVKKAAQRGYLMGLDGRLIKVRSEHAALNMLLQTGGSILVKVATVHANEQLPQYGGKQVGHWHDEWLVECDPEQADNISPLLDKGMKYAEGLFDINCPLAADWSVGESWADVH